MNINDFIHVSEVAQALRELQQCREENEKVRERIEQAHMAGQHSAGVDPSYSEAQAYLLRQEEI